MTLSFERLSDSRSLTHLPLAAHMSALWGHQSSLQEIAFFGAFCNMTEKGETCKCPGEPHVVVSGIQGNGSWPSLKVRETPTTGIIPLV